jgi:hypothetical protein
MVMGSTTQDIICWITVDNLGLYISICVINRPAGNDFCKTETCSGDDIIEVFFPCNPILFAICTSIGDCEDTCQMICLPDSKYNCCIRNSSF